MTIQYISIYFFVAVMICAALFAITISSGRTRYTKVLSALSLAIFIYILGYLLELNSVSLEQMKFWNRIQYFGIPFFPAFWLYAAFLYTRGMERMRGWRTWLIFVVPLFCFMARMTNDLHSLFYTSMTLVEYDDLSLMLLKKGPFYWIQTAYVLGSMVLGNVLYYPKKSESNHIQRRKYKLLFMASVTPYIAVLLVAIDIGNLGIDYTAAVIPIAVLVLIYVVYRYDFLEIKSMGREKLFEDNTSGMVLVNLKYRVIDYNDAAKEYFRIFHLNLTENSFQELLVKYEEMSECIESKESKILELIDQERLYYIEIMIKPIAKLGQQFGYLVSFTDVTAKELLQQKLASLAAFDELSGLYNRRTFMEKAMREFEHALRYQESFAVIMMDIDFFKRINDVYGHAAGDEAIRQFGQLLKSTFRKTDLYGRMGGEEFALMMIQTTLDDVEEKLEQFRKEVEALRIQYQERIFRYTVSIGVKVIQWPVEGDLSLDEILSQADACLYESKKAGRNRVTFY